MDPPPAYILPHPHVQPVDYRRFLPPQVHAPGVPFQNTNHGRRVRPPSAVPFRETVNSAVQTEPAPRSADRYTDVSPPIRTDSGHGSTTDSPSSSGSFSKKQLAAELENCVPSRTLQATGCSRGAGQNHAPHPRELKTVRAGLKAAVAPQRGQNGGTADESPPGDDVWSVGSPDSMVPVWSSSQQRRGSFPDVLLSWSGSTPRAPSPTSAERGLGQDAESDLQGPETTNADKGVGAAEILSLSKRFLDSARTNVLERFSSARQSLVFAEELSLVSDEDQGGSDGRARGESSGSEDPAEVTASQRAFSHCHLRRKMNESVWSVESLCPFIPSEEGAQHSSGSDSARIMEMTEEPQDGRSSPNGKFVSKSSPVQVTQSVVGSVPVSAGRLLHDSPSEEPVAPKGLEPRLEQEPQHTVSSPVLDLSEPQTPLQHKNILFTLTTKEVAEDGSAGAESDGTTAAEPAAEAAQRVRSSPPPPQEDALPVGSTLEDRTAFANEQSLPKTEDEDVTAAPPENKTRTVLGSGLCPPVPEQGGVPRSPSSHLVDFGVQCSQLLPCARGCCEEPLRKNPLKYSGTCIFKQYINIYINFLYLSKRTYLRKFH